MKKYMPLLIVFMVLALMLGNSVTAAEPLRLSLEDAIQRTVKTRENIQINQNEVEIRDAQYKEEKAAIYPQINSETSWSNNFDHPHNGVTSDYDVSSGVSMTQLLWAFGKVSAAIDAADNYLKIGEYNQEATVKDTVYDANVGYYAALLAQKTLDIVEESYSNVEANKKILEERSSSGRISKRDIIKMSSDLATRKPKVNNAKATLNSSLKTLKRLTGIDPQSPVSLTDNFEAEYQEIDFNELKTQLHANESSLKVLKETIRFNERLVKVRKANFYPEVSAFTSWTYKGSSDEMDIGGANVDQYGIAGLKVSVPIWNGGEKVHQLKQARLQKENAELNYQKGEKDLVLELDSTVSQYNEHIQTYQANLESVKLAEESFKMSRDLFTSGKISLSDLNDAELILTNEKLSLQQTLYNLNLSLALIEKLTAEGRAL